MSDNYSVTVSVPDEIILPHDIPNLDLFKQWLKEKSGNAVDILVPQRGEKAHLVELARRNAELLLGEQQLAKQMRERIPISLIELQKHLRLTKTPNVIAAFDISTLQGTDKVRLHGCLQRRKTGKIGVSQIQDSNGGRSR